MDYKRIRDLYGLSMSGMSTVLGFGVNQWRLYESGRVEPKDCHDRLIRLAMDPESMLKLVTRTSGPLIATFGLVRYNRLVDRVTDVLSIHRRAEREMYRKWVEGLYE